MRGERPTDFQTVIDELRGIAGAPETVRAFIKARQAECGCDYITGQFVFGDMNRAEALHSINLFASDVLPAVTKKPAMAPAG